MDRLQLLFQQRWGFTLRRESLLLSERLRLTVYVRILNNQ
jgi:hypothetical protein